MTDLTALSPADRHRAVAVEFAKEIAATPDWSAPAPVDGWTALDVVRHLIDWFPGFLAGGGIELPSAGSVDDDPVAAWASKRSYSTTSGRTGRRIRVHPPDGGQSSAGRCHRPLLHGRRLHAHLGSRGRIRSHRRPRPAFAEQLLSGMLGIEDMLRASGQYGRAVAVPPTPAPSRS